MVGTPVTSTADSGPGSLRETLAAARDGDTLRFTTAGTVTLASPITVAQGVTLDAAGKGRALEVAAGAEVTLKGGVGQPVELATTTSQALSLATWGGNLLSSGILTLDGTTVTGGHERRPLQRAGRQPDPAKRHDDGQRGLRSHT